MRMDDDSSDVDDIRRLLDELGLEDAEAAMDIVADFCPGDAVPPKTQFGLEAIFQGNDGRPS